MASCPNTNLQSWKDLVASVGEDTAYYLWDKYEGNIPQDIIDDIAIDNERYQLSDPQKDVVKQLATTTNDLYKVDKKTTDEKGKEVIKQVYMRTTPTGEKEIDNRVTDIVRQKAKEAGFDEENLTTSEKTFNAFKRDLGIKFHGYFEDIHNRFFNKAGIKRPDALDRPPFNSKVDEQIYGKLETYFTDLVNSLPEGTIFLSEQMLYNPKTDTAGTVDLLAIDKTGKTHIFDWKFGTVYKGEEDIPWYKQRAYDVQIGAYKGILKDVYGMKDFGNMRAIPIILQTQIKNKMDGTTDYNLTGAAIGSVDPTKIKSLLLTPISEQTESTGDKKIDEMVRKINVLTHRLEDSSATDDQTRDLKIEKLSAFRRAARLIQGQSDLSGLIQVIEVLKNQGDKIVNEYNLTYKDRAATSLDSTDKELSNFAMEMQEFLASADLFDRIDIQLEDYLYTPEMEIDAITDEDKEYVAELKATLTGLRKQTRDIYESREQVKQIIMDFGAKHVGERNLTVGLLSPEAISKGISSNFQGAADIGIKAANILYKLNLQARSNAKEAAEEGVNKLIAIRDRLIKRGNVKELMNKIFKRTKDGDKVNQLVNRFDTAFKEEFKKNAIKDDVKWLFDNIDTDKVREEANKIINRKIDTVNKFYADDEEKRTNAIQRIKRIWDIDDPDFSGWKENYLLQKYPLDKWYSKEFKEIMNDPDLKELYQYVAELNEKATDVGFISKKLLHSFLPFVRKEMAERFAQGSWLAPIQSFYDSIKMNPDDVGYGSYDEITGKLENSIPKYYTKDFSVRKNGPNDYTDVSFDLLKNLILYTQEVEKFKYLNEVEGQVDLLKTIEEFKNEHLATNRSGNVIMDANGDPKIEKGNEDNIKTLDQFTRALFYGQKYVLSDVDTPLGLNKAVTAVKKIINKVAGREIVKIDDDSSPTSLVKLMDAFNRGFQLKTLGLDPLPGLVNFAGSQFQISAIAGNYFTQGEFTKNEGILLNHKFRSKEDREIFAQLINNFVPLREDPSYEKLKKSSVFNFGNVLNGSNISDFLMVMFRKPEMFVEKAIFMSILDNTMVENGKIVNIREYVKDKYKNRYDSSNNFKDSEGKIDSEIEELQKTRSITATKKLENGKLVIPGLNLDNKKETRRITNLTRNTTNRVVGSLSQENINKMQMSIWTRSMLTFKNWIYPLLETRFSGIRKVASDDFSVEITDGGLLEGEKYDVGRASLFFGLMYDSIKERQNNILNILKVNDAGVEKLEEVYAKYQARYYKKTGQRLTMSSADFKDMIRNNLRNEIKEIGYIVALTSAMFALGIISPGDDDDKATKNRYRYYQRALDKLRDEITFFYNPNEIRNIAAGGLFPAVSMITDVTKLIKHITEEITGIGIGGKKGRTPDQVRKDAKPLKDVLKIVPGGKFPLMMGASISDQFAKDFDITIQAQNTVR